MLDVFVAIILSALTADNDVIALQRFAPEYLSVAAAREHIGAARHAGAQYSIEPTVLLASAYNESRFSYTVSGRDTNGLMTCGVTGVQHGTSCNQNDMTLVRGYQRGAEALRGWLRYCS